MLERGTDIQVIKEMLGHKLSATELYARVSINLLKHVYFATHPGPHLKPPGAATERNAEAEAAEDAEPL